MTPSPLLFLAFSLLFSLSMYGWGRPLQRFGAPPGIILAIVLGLGVNIVSGGLLNALSLAYGWVLNLHLAAGVLLAAYVIIRERPGWPAIISRWQRHRWALLVSLLFIAVLLGTLTITALIPAAFNFHDDYQKYFVHPVKLISTGTLFGSPLSALGKEFLGAQALLQAYFVENLGIHAFNSFDYVLCQLLAALLLIEQGFRRGQPWAGLLGALLLVMIHPQYVNVSAFYSSILFMLGAAFCSERLLTREGTNAGTPAWALLIALALCYTAVVAVKTTFALFPAIHFLLLFLAIGLLQARSLRVPARCLLIPVISLLCILPWALPILQNLEALSLESVEAADRATGQSMQLARLLSLTPEFYGGMPLQYTLVALLTAVAGGLAIARRATQRPSPDRTGAGALGECPQDAQAFMPCRASGLAALLNAATLVLIYFGIMLTLQPTIHTFGTALRYTMPYLTALAPAVVLLVLTTSPAPLLSRASSGLMAGLTLLAALQFIPQAQARLNQSQQCGSMLAFSSLACSQAYQRYSAIVLTEDTRQRVEEWQSLIPSGEPVIAWINTPFYLDFQRNPVHEVDVAGLENPWARLPQARYLIWEYQGYATRPIATLLRNARSAPLYERRVYSRTLDFIALLQEMERRGEARPLYQSRQVKIYRLELSEARAAALALRLPAGRN